MSKAQAITLPFVLLLWDYWPLCRVNSLDECVAPANALYAKRSWRQLASEKLPFFAMCVPSAILTLRAQSAAGAVTAFTRYPLPIRVANATVSYARYLGKAVSPSHLSLMYPYQPQSLTNWQILLAVLLLVSITCAVFSGGKRYLTVGWLWFLGTLVPMIGLVQVGVQSMADRYAYLPFIGLFIAVCWGAADLAGDRPSARELLIWCSCLLLTALAFGSHRQIGYWSSDLNLWSHAVAVTDENFIAEDGMGNSLLEQGELEEAVPHFQKAVAIRPTDPISNANLAFYKMRNGDLTGALAQYRIALSNTRNEILRANAFTNIGSIENQLGNISAARDDYAQAVILRPRNALAWTGLGVVNQKIGDYDAAVRAFSRAVALQPSDVTYLLLAAALQKDGKSPEAESATRTAIHLSQNIEEAHRFVNGMLGP